MAQDRLGGKVRSQIEQYADATGTALPPIPSLAGTEVAVVTDAVRQKIERGWEAMQPRT